jgi:hypothetical protein
VIADRGDEAKPVDRRRDVLRGAEIERDGLFDEERQLVVDSEAFGFAVRERRHADVERVEVYRGQHRGRIVERARAEAGRGFGRAGHVDIGDCDDRNVVELLQDAEMAIGDAACADEPDPCPLHAVSLCVFGLVLHGVVDRARVGDHAIGRE